MENKEIENLFALSFKYLDEILKGNDIQHELTQLYDSKAIKFVEKSISFIYYHKNERFNNSYKIKIEIEYGDKMIGYYYLFLDNNQNFIDEFFIIN